MSAAKKCRQYHLMSKPSLSEESRLRIPDTLCPDDKAEVRLARESDNIRSVTMSPTNHKAHNLCVGYGTSATSLTDVMEVE